MTRRSRKPTEALLPAQTAPVPLPAAISRAEGSDGGVFDKIGNWYEEAAVALHLLRVLWEQAESVTWEPPGTDGIDYQVVERGRRIAVQAKTRRSASWYPSALADPLAYARRWLEQNPGHWYRFQTDQKPQALIDAGDAARSEMTDAAWLAQDADRLKYAAAVGCDATDTAALARARDCFRRIEVEVTGKEVISERIRELAIGLTHDDADTLILGLMAVTRTTAFLRRTHGASALRQALHVAAVTVRWNGSIADRTTAAWLHDRRDDFVQMIAAARRGRAAIPRDEVPRIITAVKSAALGGVILVHGAAGSGKSEVLCQVVEQLDHLGVVVLPWRGDTDPSALTGGERTPVRRLLATSAGGRACLVIDQLDQVAYIAQTNAVVRQWIRDALSAGIPVVVGCRTVDAHQDTHLHHMLFHQGVPTTEIEVGLLPDHAIQERLVPLGIPLADLGPDLLRLVRNPMLLGLVEDLVRQRGRWHGMTSLWEVVDAWCGQQGPETAAVLDALVMAMEREGSLAIHPDLVQGDWQRLVNEGLLLRDSMGRLRIFHQLIADVRLARTWMRADTLADLLAHLGPRQHQGFREARRVRLCLPQIVARGSKGIALVRDLVFHNGLRPLVQRAAFLGLAEVATIEPRMMRLMEEWLADSAYRGPLLDHVVRGSQPWFEALTVWLDRAWTERPDEEWILLDLCASVSLRCGDAVARHLQSWEQQRPGTLVKARQVFLQNPATDSDELFALRLDTLARDAELRHHYVDWSGLVQQHPARAAALFMLLVRRWTPPDGRIDESPSWLMAWPAELPSELTSMPWNTWDPLWTSWRERTLEYLWQVDLDSEPSPGFWLTVVGTMAQVAAAALLRQETTWADVRARLPVELRDQDGWLLLRTGQLLGRGAVRQQELADASDWFMSDPRWARLNMGFEADHHRRTLAAQFLAAVARGLEPVAHERLQDWLRRYPDPWSTAHEQFRYHDLMLGHDRPTDHGLTAWILLPALDRERWTTATASTHDHLRRKFAPYAKRFEEYSSSGFGKVESPIPPDVSGTWSDQTWIRQLQRVPKGRGAAWRHNRKGVIHEHSLMTLLSLLRNHAEQDPQRYLSLARALPAASPPGPDDAFSWLIAAVGGVFAAAGQPRIDDTTIAALVDQPAYRDRESCAREMAMLVEQRAEHAWSPAILDRLRQIAQAPAKRSVSATATTNAVRINDLLSFRINDAPCIALHALGAVAEHRPELHAVLSGFAETLVDHPDQGRRASVARLALGCYAGDPTRCAGILLRLAQDPVIPAERDLRNSYTSVAVEDSVAEPVRDALRRCLMDLCAISDPPFVAEAGGQAVVRWWVWGKLEREEFRRAIAISPRARHEAARHVAGWMAGPQATRRICEEAIAFADDPSPEVGAPIMQVLGWDSARHLYQDTSFIAALAASAAGRRDPTGLINGCDKQGNLHPMGAILLDMACHAAGQATPRGTFLLEQHADLLMRLHEEAQRSGDDELAVRALDALDSLLLAGLSQSRLLVGLTSEELP